MTDTTTKSRTDEMEDRNAEPGITFNAGTISIVSLGSIISLVILLAIIRELFLCCRLPRSNVTPSATYDVYADIGDIGNRL